jgi:hypothetical protein
VCNGCGEIRAGKGLARAGERGIVARMSSYRVIQVSGSEWAIEFTPAGHPASTVKGGFASEAAAQAEVKALEAQDEWEAEQP